jgi:PKD domain
LPPVHLLLPTGAVVVMAMVAPCGAVEPEALLDVTPNPAAVGETVTFDASRSDDTSRYTEYDWDLDGDGDFERETGLLDRTTTSYSTPGVRTVAVKVVNPKSFAWIGGFNVDVDSERLPVLGFDTPPSPGEPANQPPTASFVIKPNPQNTDLPVEFDASTSSDPDGSIVRYRWDLDGDGTLETDTGASSSVSDGPYDGHPNSSEPRQYNITLEVTDNGGDTNTTARLLVIDDSAGSPSASAAAQRLDLRGAARFSVSLGGKQLRRGLELLNGRRYTITGVVSRGRLRTGNLPSPLSDVRRAGWLGRTNFSLNLRTDRRRASGIGVLSFGDRGHLCTSFAMTAKGNRPATGRLLVTGGSGELRNIRGGARFKGTVRRGKPPVAAGRIKLEEGRPRPMGRDCRRLLRTFKPIKG